MPDFTENTSGPSTTWNEATRDPTRLYGMGVYGVGKYGVEFVLADGPDFTEAA